MPRASRSHWDCFWTQKRAKKNSFATLGPLGPLLGAALKGSLHWLDTLYSTFACLVCNAHASRRSSHPTLNYTSAPLLKHRYLLHLMHFTLSRIYRLALCNHLPISGIHSC